MAYGQPFLSLGLTVGIQRCTCLGHFAWCGRRGSALPPSLSAIHCLPQAASITLSLKSSSAWSLFFSHAMVTLPPSSIVMVPYRIPEEMQLVLGFIPESLCWQTGKEGGEGV